jgi:branched-chain amino acid transport system permease protein
MKKYGRIGIYFLILAIAIALPLLFNMSKKGKYQIQLFTFAMIWAIAALSLNLILGYTGQASLAHGAFMGIGAYAFAIMVERVGINFWLALPLTCLVTAFIGLLIGLPSLRTKGPYFAILTLCFNVIVMVVFFNWTWLSGGTSGQGVTIPSYLSQRWVRYYVVLFFLILVLLIERQIVKSLSGSSLIAVRSNETLAEAVGIRAFREKLIAFTASCFLIGLAGAFLAVELGSINYNVTNYLNSFYILIYLLIGGAATLAGPVVGAVGLYWLLDRIRFMGDFRYLIFGLILILVIIYMPMGIVGAAKQFWEWAKERWKRKGVTGDTPAYRGPDEEVRGIGGG